LVIIFGWLFLAIIVGVAANTRGRNPVAWTFLAIVFSPLMIGLLVLALPNVYNEHTVDETALRRSAQSDIAAPQQRGPFLFGWGIMALILGVIVFGYWLNNQKTVSIAAPDGPISNALLTVSPDAQATALGKSVGNRCVGKSSFFMGSGASGFAKGTSFWSVRCRDGRTFAVQENPDRTSVVMACSLLRDMHVGECFRKIAD
jgi:hypothetical protein